MMADQEKLNDAGMFCHLIEVLTWWHDAAIFPIFFYVTKSVVPIQHLHTPLLVLPVPYTTSKIHQYSSPLASLVF